MPINKDKLRRIEGIDNRLKRWRRAKKHRLARIFSVTEKTIQRDIKYMKEVLDAPITNDQEGYYYTTSFELKIKTELSGDEINQLKIAVKTLNQFQHLDVFANLETIIEQIDYSVHFKTAKKRSNFIYFEKVPFYEGTELLDFFIESIEQQRAVRFHYCPYKTDTTLLHVFHPYLIKEHTNRWYVVGFLPSQDSYCSFALDRIIQDHKLFITDDNFTVKKGFDPKIFFQYTYGMTVHTEHAVEEMVLAFTPLQAKYFISKPFYPYEEITTEREDIFIVRMNIIPNFEFLRKIASMGDGVKVLKPLSFQQKLLAYHQNAIQQYYDSNE